MGQAASGASGVGAVRRAVAWGSVTGSLKGDGRRLSVIDRCLLLVPTARAAGRLRYRPSGRRGSAHSRGGV